MAVTRKENVIRIDADNDTIAGPLKICGILYIAGSTPSATIRADQSDAGMILWQTTSTADRFDEVEINLQAGAHIDLAGTGTVLYLYLK